MTLFGRTISRITIYALGIILIIAALAFVVPSMGK